MRNLSAFQPSGNTKAYYPLNNNSNDYSGNLNTGTPTDITYPQGRFGQGAKFNGTSSLITIADSDSISLTGDFTISFWMKLLANPAGSDAFNIFTKYTPTGNQRSYQIFYAENSGNYDMVLTVNADGASASTAVAWSSLNLGLSNWKHIVVKYTASTHLSELYLNGRSISVQDSVRTSIFNSTSPLVIGSTAAGGSYLNGLVDEVIIESRAWTAKEVETYYRKSTLNYKPKGLFANLLQSFSNFFAFFQ